MKRNAFTLIELLVVIAIMGIMGTAAVGGYRAMQRGMEERGVMENVNQFIRSAYQRAQIDRGPVAIYFWNETLREETDFDTVSVVGRAVAVRRSGRLSDVQGSYLFDEFGDLRFMKFSFLDDEDEDDTSTSSSGSSASGTFLYPMNGTKDGDSMKRSIISQAAVRKEVGVTLLSSGEDVSVEAYAFHVLDAGGVRWQRGDAYGMEFATIQLPHNYIFGTSYSDKTSKPVVEVKKLLFMPGQNSGNGSQGGISGDATVDVASLRPGASGALQAQKVDTSDNPTQRLN